MLTWIQWKIYQALAKKIFTFIQSECRNNLVICISYFLAYVPIEFLFISKNFYRFTLTVQVHSTKVDSKLCLLI